jgi:hypothetical protein
MCDNEGGMAVYHVFVDGAADASSAGKEQLATAISSHYGMPIDAVRARVTSGRFRVKGNCDRATADTYVRDLSALGARCSIEEATQDNSAKTPLPFPVRPAAATALPPRQTTPPAMAHTTSGSKEYQSGLSAAFGERAVSGLGALSDDGAMLKLSSVDGTENNEPSADAFAPPVDAALPASIGPAAKIKAPVTKPVASADPIDMFAPPDAADAEVKMDLAPDEVERSAKKRASIPPANAEVPRPRGASLQPPSTTRTGRTSMPPPNLPAPSGLADPRTRFVVGVLLAIVIGFIPAHFVASSRERSAFADTDSKVAEIQKQVVTIDDYAALDAMRTRQLERKHDDRRNIALIALLLWAGVGAGVAFVYFKKLVPPPTST